MSILITCSLSLALGWLDIDNGHYNFTTHFLAANMSRGCLWDDIIN